MCVFTILYFAAKLIVTLQICEVSAMMLPLAQVF
jgi:hypothetical protein